MRGVLRGKAVVARASSRRSFSTASTKAPAALSSPPSETAPMECGTRGKERDNERGNVCVVCCVAGAPLSSQEHRQGGHSQPPRPKRRPLCPALHPRPPPSRRPRPGYWEPPLTAHSAPLRFPKVTACSLDFCETSPCDFWSFVSGEFLTNDQT